MTPCYAALQVSPPEGDIDREGRGRQTLKGHKGHLGAGEKPATVAMCEVGVCVWEPLEADGGSEGSPQEAGGEIWFDSTPLKRGHQGKA